VSKYANNRHFQMFRLQHDGGETSKQLAKLFTCLLGTLCCFGCKIYLHSSAILNCTSDFLWLYSLEVQYLFWNIVFIDKVKCVIIKMHTVWNCKSTNYKVPLKQILLQEATGNRLNFAKFQKFSVLTVGVSISFHKLE
jgi:hypothetical protein